MQLRLRSVVKGAATFVPGLRQLANSAAGSAVGPRYFYSVWMRHLVRVNQACGPFRFDVVAELGPGDALGLGLCALLSGARRYLGLDRVAFTTKKENLSLLQSLVELFQARSPIPDDDEFPGVFPRLSSYSFPSHILSDQGLASSLASNRLRALRDLLAGTSNSSPDLELIYVAPWNADANIASGSVDWIFSQAVLEHVDDISGTFAALRAWLRTDGIMSHRIDYTCHGITRDWYGHWTISQPMWKLVRGKRAYLINRLPHSAHLAAMKAQGFDILVVDPTESVQAAPSNEVRISCEVRDLSIKGAFVIARPNVSV